MKSFRVFLRVLDGELALVVRTDVYALTPEDAEIHARATAATEGWCVTHVKTQLLPL